MANEIDFTIGADPEFCCVNGKSLVESANYTTTEAPFGRDGNGVTFEVRPGPSTNPVEVVDNIHDIFVRQINSQKEFGKFSWKAGSFYADCPLGGHIHFGISERKISIDTAATVLDNYVGAISVLIECKNQGLRRRQENYGRRHDVRAQNWGFEYRTSSSWLTSPYVSAAMLCLAKTVMYELLNNPRFTPSQFVVDEDFTQMRTEVILEQFPKLWKDITGMKLYQTYKPYIDIIYLLVKKGLTWFPQTTMKESWGLIDLTAAYKDTLKMNVIWERFNQEVSQYGRARRIVPVERVVRH